MSTTRRGLWSKFPIFSYGIVVIALHLRTATGVPPPRNPRYAVARAALELPRAIAIPGGEHNESRAHGMCRGFLGSGHESPAGLWVTLARLPSCEWLRSRAGGSCASYQEARESNRRPYGHARQRAVRRLQRATLCDCLWIPGAVMRLRTSPVLRCRSLARRITRQGSACVDRARTIDAVSGVSAREPGAGKGLLPVRCPPRGQLSDCRTELPPAAKFCLECGERITSQARRW